MIFLASPYSHPDPAVRLLRFLQACRAAAWIVSKGLAVYSPIAHTHPIALAGRLPLDAEEWEPINRWMIKRCDEVCVLALPGWKDSDGVAAEIKIAKALGKPVSLWSYREEDVEHHAEVTHGAAGLWSVELVNVKEV